MTRATGRPVGVANPERVAARQHALLEALRKSPGLRGCELCRLVTTEPAAATATRLYRLMGLGEVERVGGKWYIAGTAPEASGPDLSLDDERVLSAMRIVSGGSSSEIAALAGCTRSAVLSRMPRLARLGLVTKAGGHWRFAERDAHPHHEGDSEFETPERSTFVFAFDRTRWIWPIDFYVDRVFNPNPFACRRYG
jgi:hypothetical protein